MTASRTGIVAARRSGRARQAHLRKVVSHVGWAETFVPAQHVVRSVGIRTQRRVEKLAARAIRIKIAARVIAVEAREIFGNGHRVAGSVADIGDARAVAVAERGVLEDRRHVRRAAVGRRVAIAREL